MAAMAQQHCLERGLLMRDHAVLAQTLGKLLSENRQLRATNYVLASKNSSLQLQAAAGVNLLSDLLGAPPGLEAAEKLPDLGAPKGHEAPPLQSCFSSPHGTKLGRRARKGKQGVATAATPTTSESDACSDKGAAVAERQLQLKYPFGEGQLEVQWRVAARRLKGKGVQLVSPSFNVGDLSFRLMLKPRTTGTKWGEASFKKSRGHGFVEVKCESATCGSACPLSFRVSVAKDGLTCRQGMRGPVLHDFACGAVASLPQELEDWDLRAAVDSNNDTFTVCLEVALPESDHVGSGPC